MPTPKEIISENAKRYANRLTDKLNERHWEPKRAHIEQARNAIQDLVEEFNKETNYETQLRECLRNFHEVVSADLNYLCNHLSSTRIEYLEKLVRDANNILNREDSSYSKNQS